MLHRSAALFFVFLFQLTFDCSTGQRKSGNENVTPSTNGVQLLINMNFRLNSAQTSTIMPTKYKYKLMTINLCLVKTVCICVFLLIFAEQGPSDQ